MKRILTKALAVVLAGTLLVSYPAQAFAWDSYESITNIVGIGSPLHEDMTQMAYVRLMQQAPQVGNLLYATNNTEYQENLYYLRQGAYWNDVPADTGIQFGYNYLKREEIPAYSGGSYSGAADIGTHLKEVGPAIEGESILFTSRAGVRMSHNRRGNILHAMLGVQANGQSYISQTQQRDWSLEWIEAAYKYANQEALTAEQSEIITFIDPYGQLVAGTPDGVPPAGVFDDATRKMNDRQMRLRALGMICHTLEDSYNPAHTIRTYYGDQAGPILAFGVYEVQKKHANYDHMAAVDATTRKDVVNNTKTLNGATSYPDIEGKVDGLVTLALSDSSTAAYTLLNFFYQGTAWDDGVADWMNQVFTCNFDANGDSYVYGGGRRAGNLEDLYWDTKDLGTSLRKIFPNQANQDLINSATGEYMTLRDYQRYLDDFYHEHLTEKKYHADNNWDSKGLIAAQEAINDYYALLTSDEESEVLAKLAKLNPSVRGMFKQIIDDTNGIIQETSLDMNNTLDTTSQSRAEWMIALLDQRTGTATGSIESVSGNEFVLRLNDNNGSILFTYEGSAFDDLQVGNQNVEVSYIQNQPFTTDDLFTYQATGVSVSGGERVFDSKGVVKSISDTEVVVTIEGSGDYTFALDGSTPAGIAVGDRIIVKYSAGEQQLLFKGATKIEGANLVSQTGIITEFYGNVVIIEFGELGEDEFPERMAFRYGNTDILGHLQIGAAVDVLYCDNDEMVPSDDPISGAVDMYEASRIAVANHEHEFIYASNQDGTHTKTCIDLDVFETGDCTNVDGTCPQCGYVFSGVADPTNPSSNSTKTSSGSKSVSTGDDTSVLLVLAGAVLLAGVIAKKSYKSGTYRK